MRLFAMVSVLSSMLIAPAFAQGAAAKPVAPPAAVKPAMPSESKPAPLPMPPAMPASPTPAPELAALAKANKSLKCKGSAMMPDGSAKPMVAKITNKLELGGFWMRSVFVEAGKGGFAFESMTSYDAKTKKWHRVQVDNMGGQELVSSDGAKEGKTVWEGTAQSAMGVAKARHYEELVGKETKEWGEYSMDAGRTWVKAYEMVCTK